MLSKTRISDQDMSQVFQQALKQKGLIENADTAAIFIDLDFLSERIQHLKSVFPPGTLHTVAVKANPLAAVLKKINHWGAGLEAASLPELYLAEKAGVPADRIVFDSPVKTIDDIGYALKLGVHINADSLAELTRISELKNSMPSRSTIGIRINPQVGLGNIAMTSVAGRHAKFGVPITGSREDLIQAFLKHEWLDGVHLHIGSQGCSADLMLKGVETVLDFIREVNSRLANAPGGRTINILDIGGGLPVSYHRCQHALAMDAYSSLLFTRFPELRSFDLITEFGRYVHANSAWAASRVEYVKTDSHVKTAMIHLGADMFLRKCYRPDEWHHELTVVDPAGSIKTGQDDLPYVIAGPLCFAGDVLATGAILPPIMQNDYLLIHDVGAYTFSMWSRYNSRQLPKMIGYAGGGKHIEILKTRETVDQVRDFWS
jgi:diaminopimelate decarboxylase